MEKPVRITYRVSEIDGIPGGDTMLKPRKDIDHPKYSAAYKKY